MAEQISPYALTTLQRVKDRLFDSNTSSQPSAFDSVLTRMINSCSQWMERECGGRQFVIRTNTNEIYSAYGPRQQKVIARQSPIFFATITGNTTAGSNVITGVSSTTGMVVGMPVYGDNLITTYNSGGNQLRNAITAIGNTSLTLGAAASTTATGVSFQVIGLLNLQYRAGTPATAPSWTNFIPDQYELVNDGKAGVIRVYGAVPRLLDNMIRLNYVAGYPVDWNNAGNETTHQLPADLSNTVENLVVRVFKRRMLAGKGSEALEGATTSWNKEIDSEDQAVIGHYHRMPTIF